jgi:hypothetical protein
MKPEIELVMLKLADGARILRVSEPVSGLCLEKRLDPHEPVARQTDRWKDTFLSLLKRETGAAN